MSEWTDKFPDDPGWYWFYGFPWGKGKRSEPRLYMMKVNTVYGAVDNAFVYRQEAVGHWMKAEPPSLPGGENE